MSESIPADRTYDLYSQSMKHDPYPVKDGAEHRRLRNLVGTAFTPGRVKALRPRIQSITDQLIDGVQERGQMDLIADYAFEVPTTVIFELLGVPVADRTRFKAWSNAFVAPALDEASQTRAAQLMQEEGG
jgi:cytochrome P450